MLMCSKKPFGQGFYQGIIAAVRKYIPYQRESV